MAEKNRISIDFRKIRMLYYNSMPHNEVFKFCHPADTVIGE